MEASSPATPSSNSVNVLGWAEKFTVVGAAFATMASTFLPQHGGIAKSVGYGVAVLLGLVTVGLHRRGRRLTAKAAAIPVLEPHGRAILRGLDAFDEGDPLVARKIEVQRVCGRVRDRDFRHTVLSGDSGCGKTSLLRAGVVPTLKRDGIRVVYLDKPSGDPVGAITNRLLIEGNPNPDAKKESVDPPPLTVVVVDQFEEFFFTNPSEVAKGALKVWLEANLQASSGTRMALLLSIRDDYFGRLRQVAPKAVDLTSSRTSFELAHLTAQQAEEILSASAAQDGLAFDSALVSALIADLGASGHVRATELQLVSSELKRRHVATVREYETLNRAAGILERYIEDEIERSTHKDLTRIILRTLCAPERAAKSVQDADLSTLKAAAQSHGDNGSDLEQRIGEVTSQLLSARLLVRSGVHSYALVHDFFAHLIRRATASLETESERADRILRRYVSDSREDPRTRIPLRHMPFIVRRATAEATKPPEARQLLRKSALQPIVDLGMALGIVVLPLYVVQLCSYSVATTTANYLNGSAFVVVREGIPALRFLPMTDTVLVDTSFVLDDATDDRAQDALVHENFTGFRFENIGGYRKWGRDLVDHLGPVARVGAYRLLGDPVRARDVALAALPAQLEPDLVESIGLATDPDSLGLDDDFLQPLWAVAENKEPAMATERALATLGLIKLTGARPAGRRPPWSPGEWIAAMHAVASSPQVNDDSGEWPMPLFELVLTSMFQNAPNTAAASDLELLVDILKDKKAPSVAKLSVVRTMQTLAETNPKLAEGVVARLTAFSLNDVTDDYVGLPEYGIDYVANLVEEIPSAATKASLAPLIDLTSSVGKSANATASWGAHTLSVALLANPNLMTTPILEGMKSAFKDSAVKGDDHQAFAIALTRVAAMDRSEADDPVVLDAAHELMRLEMAADSVDVTFDAQRALTDLCVASPDRCPDPEGVMMRMAVLPDRRDRQSGERFTLERTTTKATLLARIARARPRALTERFAQTVVDGARAFGPRPDLVYALSSIAMIAPEDLKRLAGAVVGANGMDTKYVLEGHEWLLGALAHASYERSRIANPGGTLGEILDTLSTESSRDIRTTAVYEIFWLAMTDPVLAVTARKDLADLQSKAQPELRIDARKALEVIEVAGIYHRSRRVAAETPLCRSQLRYLTQYPDRHIRYAAQLALDAMALP
jgi:hypothetical protein